MAKSFLDGVKNFLGFETEEEEQTIVSDDMELDSGYLTEKNTVLHTGDNKVLNIRNSERINIEVYAPRDFDQAMEVVKCLRHGKPVVLNLEGNDPEMARKIFDFLNGALCALDGSNEKITRYIFLMAPKNVKIKSLQEQVHKVTTKDVDSNVIEFHE